MYATWMNPQMGACALGGAPPACLSGVQTHVAEGGLHPNPVPQTALTASTVSRATWKPAASVTLHMFCTASLPSLRDLVPVTTILPDSYTVAVANGWGMRRVAHLKYCSRTST